LTNRFEIQAHVSAFCVDAHLHLIPHLGTFRSVAFSAVEKLKFGKFFAFTQQVKRVAVQNLFHSAPSLASCHSFCFADFFHLFIGLRKIEGILYPQKRGEEKKWKIRFTFDNDCVSLCTALAENWTSEICAQFSGRDVIGERGERYIMIIAKMLSNYKFLALFFLPCAISSLMVINCHSSFVNRFTRLLSFSRAISGSVFASLAHFCRLL
jgi:hypothetical protein